MTSDKRDLIFISYHHKDRIWLDRLEVHLKPHLRERSLSAWSDTRLQAGADVALERRPWGRRGWRWC